MVRTRVGLSAERHLAVFGYMGEERDDGAHHGGPPVSLSPCVSSLDISVLTVRFLHMTASTSGHGADSWGYNYNVCCLSCWQVEGGGGEGASGGVGRSPGVRERGEGSLALGSDADDSI